ncbi:MAG: hypothetical protein IT462_11510 [Planctomycetes bacterium]|nr:hypothetical protein [Planctomycetota bacterium]
MNETQRLERLERAVEKLKRHAARTEHCLTSGCIKCSGECENEEVVWETWLDDDERPDKR